MAQSDDHIERKIGHELTIEAWATGRKESRGEISVVIWDDDAGRVARSLSPSEARQMAAYLLELADSAEKFSTRGFVGSDE